MVIEVYDLESLSNIFTYTGYRLKEDQYYQFCICDWRNDLEPLINHLKTEHLMQVGFNNEDYDYPLLHYLLNSYDIFQTSRGQTVAQALYNKSQDIISSDFSSIKYEEKIIPQIDLYRIWHLRHRGCSLKDLEFAMRMENIEDMPINHTTWCKPGDEEIILAYNLNDVKATTNFFNLTIGKTDNQLYKGKNQIELRLKLMEKFKINCLNYPDVRLGESIITKLYAQAANQSIAKLKNMQTTARSSINLADCIPSWANFKTKEFNDIKHKFQSTIITQIKDSFDESIYFRGNKLDYGVGGLHSSKVGIFNSDDEYIIVDQDVSSLYPSLGVTLKLYPEHLGPIFTDIYKNNIVDVRLAEKAKPKELRDNVIIEGYKKAANAIYGKSNEENSIFYDPLYTAKITVGGQMFISLWIETLYRFIPEFELIQANTDGLTYKIPRSQLNNIDVVTRWMTKLTGLQIENNYYSKMIIRDVNNYIAQYEDGHLKLKGCFEIDKDIYKDHSMRIIPIALKEYFINGVPIDQTIKNHKDILDFCLRLKITRDNMATFSVLNTDGTISSTQLSRTTRYYISNQLGAGILTKFSNDGSKTNINAGYTAVLFNKYKELDNYNINYLFYIQEANKIKNSIVNNQLDLFTNY